MPISDVKLDEIRKILLSLLLARPGATPVTVLDRDYYEEEGERIPWRKLGYADLVEFLNSMPEYFSTEWCSSGYFVRGIASEKTKHVSSLVSRQKLPSKSKYIPPQLRRVNRFVSRNLPQMQRHRIRLSAEQLSYVVNTCVKNNPNGISMRNVISMLQRQWPHITFSMYDVRDQLRELSHFLYLDCDMIYPKSPKSDVSQDVKNQPQSSTSKPQNMPRSPAKKAVCVGGDEGSDFSEELEDERSFVPANHVNDNYPKRSKTSEWLNANFARNANNEQNAMFNHDDYVANDFVAMNNNSDTMTRNYDFSLLIDDRTKSRLNQLVRKHPEGIWCADLPEKYLKEYNVPLNYNELGFSSVREYVSYLPNIFYMTRENSSDDFLLYTADKRPTVPDQELPRTEPIERPGSCEQHDKHNIVRIQCDNNDNAPIPADVSPTITKTLAPDDVMNYNDSVDQILVTDLQRDRKYLEVYIVEIFHPTFFWIHLRENKRHFDKFMLELHNFYEYKKGNYIIPKIALKKGLNCACIYASKWHRGIIKSVKPDFRVTIMFYDYGTLKTYAAEDVYYLHKQFSFLPAQAIACGLYNVRPCVGDRWKRSVIDKLVDRINETLLALTIISIDSLNNSMMVILSDTTEEEDEHINDWLINEKLARCGKMGDSVDMASIMKYVVNNLNQLPTYCFAEENLTSDSRCKATSTEELHEVPLVSSKQTYLYRDGLEQHSVRPPPGFAPLSEKPSLSNTSTRSSSDVYSFGNASNVKTSSYGNTEVPTNPFLSDQQLNDNIISNDIAKQIFTPIWTENMQLFINLTKILYDILERSPLSRNIFENHMTIQYHLNKFLKNFEKTLVPDSDKSTIGTSSASLNLATETMPNKVDSVEKMPVNSNAESFVNQKLAGMNNLSLNPFDDDKVSHTHNMFSAYGSNGYTFTTNWHQPDRFSPRVQVTPISSSLTPTSTCSMFTNYGLSTTNGFFPNADQGNENSSVTKPAPSPMASNPGACNNNSSAFGFSASNKFVNVFKETNPFKFCMINNMQIPEKQNEQMANNYDTNVTSYLSATNLHDHFSKMKEEAVNTNESNSFITSTEHANVNVNVGAENYTSKIVYEAGPVMYNIQKKQMDADVKHSACNSDYKNDCNVPLKRHYDNKELSSQSANDITTLKHNSSHIDEDHVRLLPTDYTLQNSSSISESNYYQKNNERIISSQAKKIEIPEHWINSQFPSDIPLENHNESSTINTSVNFSSPKDWNYNNNKESVIRNMNGTTDLSYEYIFQWNNEEKPMYKNFWNNPAYENQKSKCKNVNSDFFFDTSFVFQQIDSVKNATFIFHIDREGWMLTHEFVQIFTNFKTCSHMIAMLEAMHIKAVFRQVQRSDHPVQFVQLDHYPLDVTRDSNMRIESMHLISLQTALSLLHKLKLVTREEIDNAFKKNEFLKGSILLDMWMLIVTYRDLRQRIEQCNLWDIS